MVPDDPRRMRRDAPRQPFARTPKHVARAGLDAALDVGERMLADGGAAIDAVEAAARVLEEDPAFNAGRGSVLTAEGIVETGRRDHGRSRPPGRGGGRTAHDTRAGQRGPRARWSKARTSC